MPSRPGIYLDHNATTPVDPQVRERMLEVLDELHGNPSSAHEAGRLAGAALAAARLEAASALGARPGEVVFTGGGSEANNLAIKGIAWRKGRGHIISQQSEHPAVLQPIRFLEKNGFRAALLPVDGTGLVDPGEVRKAIRPDTILITIQHANNETGTVQPIEAIGAIHLQLRRRRPGLPGRPRSPGRCPARCAPPR